MAEIVNKGRSKSLTVMSFLNRLVQISLQHKFNVHSTYILDKCNITEDTLSYLNVTLFFLAETRSRHDHFSCHTYVAADDGLKEHLSNAIHLINQSSRNTLKACHTTWNTYCGFLASYPGLGTGNIKHVLAFESFCYMQLTLSHNTIRMYLASIQHFLSIQPPRKAFLVRSLCSQSHSTWHPEASADSKRLPFSSATFWDMSAILSRSPFGLLPSLVIQASIYLAFRGFLRQGEFTYSGPGCQVLSRCHLVRLPDNFVLHLAVSNTQQSGPRVDLKLFQTHNDWCPVAVLNQLLTHLPSQSGSNLLLPFPTSPLSANQFTRHIHILLANLGLNPAGFLGILFGSEWVQPHLSMGGQTMSSGD